MGMCNLLFVPLEQMHMEYSADDIAAARNIQFSAYICTILATFWIYDYACSFQEECKFLLRSHWTKVKVLYIVTRYGPFFIIAGDLYRNFALNESANECLTLNNVYSCFAVISFICSECFFVLRTYALWNNKRIVLVAMLSTLFAIIATSIGIRFTTIATSHVTTSAIPGITGCSWDSSSVRFFMPFILLFAFQLGLFSLTLIHVVQSWRSAKGHLHVVLMNHNMFYYTSGLLLSGVNVLVPVLLSNPVYYSLFEGLQVFILAILATRMHLYLWQTDRNVNGSEALVCISMSDMSPADRAV
ncbi:hypothetical protein BDR05DRAFT_961303 [Suillus weaverae]|nr:hypothetical protein BDR05DRAFT_961303 [Suillus weaverae]